MAGFSWYQSNGKCAPLDRQVDEDQIPLYSLADVQLRFLCPEDLDEVRTLCQDWFPIEYPFYWYEEITSCTRFYSLAAVYQQTIIGLIVAEIKPYATLSVEDTGILANKFMDRSDIAYILSLGVLKQFRRNGIASLLLDSLIRHLITIERNKVKAVFLHVLTTNSAAIRFYERRNDYIKSMCGKVISGGGFFPWILLNVNKAVQWFWKKSPSSSSGEH